MAGEKLGIAYEALTVFALRKTKSGPIASETVFWNEKPSGMSIETDVTIGKTKDAISHLFLINHSEAATNSNMKFWRNIGEIVEAKTNLAKIPVVVSVIFNSIIKQDLKAIQISVFDHVLIVGTTDYGHILRRWAEEYANKLPANKEEKLEFLSQHYAGSNEFSQAIDCFCKELSGSLNNQDNELKALWQQHRKSTGQKDTHRVQAKTTYFRRGIAKLLVLGEPFARSISKDGRLTAKAAAHAEHTIMSLDWGRKTLRSIRVTDPEILWVVRELPPDLVNFVCENSLSDKMMEWIKPVRDLAELESQLRFINSKWKELTTTSGLFENLKRCKSNPRFHLEGDSGLATNDTRVWLFHVLIDWLKISLDSKAYGIHQLLKELRNNHDNELHRQSVKNVTPTRENWNSAETIRLGLQDWHTAASEQAFPLSELDLCRVADLLAKRLSTVAPPEDIDISNMKQATIQSNLERKLFTYSSFTPIELLLRYVARKAKVSMPLATSIACCFSEKARYIDPHIDRRSGTTSVLLHNRQLIKWQTATDSGKGHKKKELCGRAFGLRYTWDGVHYSLRKNIDELILILDGTWDSEDIAALIHAGWDRILYCNEVDKLFSESE
jgi:hypothetical protein